ncbi:HAD family hydrolase [Candidatus Microgenomates bacterium]|nr:MAG: HAD family hydrolase [Candidatus Microgenomates bacterium]
MKLLIFDFDGPINDLIDAKRKTIEEISHQLGLSFPDIVSWGIINYIDQIYESEKIYDYKDLVAKSLEKLQEKNLIVITEEQKSEFANMFAETLARHQMINHGLMTTVNSTKKMYPEVKFCIYTGQKEEAIINLLEKSSLDKTIFDKIYGRDYFDEPKPSIENLKKICEEFGIEPSDAVAIGDNVAVDLAPASYLGMKTVLINAFVNSTVANLNNLISVLK